MANMNLMELLQKIIRNPEQLNPDRQLATIEELNAQLENIQAEFSKRAETIDLQQVRITELQQQATTLETRSTEQAGELRQQAGQIEQLEGQLTLKVRQLAEMEAKLAAEKEQLNQKLAELNQQLGQYKVADNLLASTRATVADLQSRLQAVEDDAARKARQIAQLQQQVADLQRKATIADSQLNRWRYRTF